MTHICIGNLFISRSDIGLLPELIWTNAVISLIGPLGTNVSDILIEINYLSLKKVHLKMSAKWRSSRVQCVKHPHTIIADVFAVFKNKNVFQDW